MNRKVLAVLGWALLFCGMIALGAQLARLGWTVLGANVLANPVFTADADPPTMELSEEKVAALISAAPFGLSIPASAAGVAGTVMADQLTLHAVRLSEDETASRAVLSISGGPMAIYREGDSVGELGIVRKIEARRVIVEIAGEEALVQFPDSSAAAALPPLYAAMASQYANDSAGRAAATSFPANDVTSSIRTQINANPQALVESLGLRQSADGYVVGSDTPPVLIAAGLKPGDKVIKVNGSVVGDPASDRLLFEQAVASGRARVEVLRGDQTIVLSFPLQ